MTDTDTDLFSLMGNLNLTIGRTCDAVQALRKESHDRWKALQETPRFIGIHAQATLDANGFAVIKFDNDGPDIGRMWYLRKLTIGGVTPATAVNGRADIHVSTMDYRRFTTYATVPTMDWRDSATTLPLVGTFAPGEIVLQHMEQLFIVMSSGTNGQDIHVQGTVEDFQTGSYASDWAL